MIRSNRVNFFAVFLSCFLPFIVSAQDGQIADPNQINLGALVGKASFVSDIGRFEVRWPRVVEDCFGTIPSRAVADAAQAVNRALKSVSFDSRIRNGTSDWDVVFTDEATAVREFPSAIAAGRHPGFMVPPNKVYIIADYIVPGGSSGSKANDGDQLLARVLIHELGHVIEFKLLENAASFDSERAEGFAAWFEQLASDYASLLPRGSAKAHYVGMAHTSVQDPPGTFSGSAYDYARASMYFAAIVDRRGVSGLMGVYDEMRNTNKSFLDAVESKIGWDRAKLQQEAIRVVGQ